MTKYALLFLAALALSLLLTPLVRHIATVVGAIDLPGGRKIHTRPIPRLGGVSVFIAFFLVKLILVRLSGLIFRNSDTATEYIQNMFIYNLFGGIILLPMLLLFSYSGTPIFLFIAV